LLNNHPAANPAVNITKFKIVSHTGMYLIAIINPIITAIIIAIEIHCLFVIILLFKKLFLINLV
jgi:hypothetical protein